MKRKSWLLTGLFGIMLTLTLVFFGCGDLGNPDGPGTDPEVPTTTTGVAATPVITIQPNSKNYAQNADADDLSVTASVSAGELSYQWYSNTALAASGGARIDGAINSSYTVSTAEIGDTYYYVVVTNTDTSKTTPTATRTSSPVRIKVSATEEAPGTAAATITVDTAVKHQWVRGFGGMMNGWGNSPPMSQRDVDTAFSPDGLGLNIFRVMIYPYMDDLFNGKEEAPPSEPDAHQFYYSRIRRAKSYGADILASPWTPPAEWKSTGSRVGGAKLLEEYWPNYAQHLKDYIARMATNNAAIDFISIQNEPDIGVSYDGCDWTGEEMRDFIKQWARFIAPADGPVKIMPGESYQFRDAFFNPIYNDPAAMAAIDVIAGHWYGSGRTRHPRAIDAGKEVWMTEHLLNTASNYYLDSQWQSVWAMIEELHDAMVYDYNAFVWWYIKRFYGLIGDSEYGTQNGAPLFRGYAMSHYAKYAADKTRVDANFTQGSNADLFVTAYESDTEITLVLFNRGSTDIGQSNIELPAAVTSASLVITKGSSNTQVETTGQAMQPGIIILSADKKTGTFDVPASSIISVRFTK